MTYADPYSSGARAPLANGHFRGSGTMQLPNLYRKPSEAEMAQTTQTVSFGLFQWIVSGLMSLIVIVLGGGLGLLISEVSDVKTDIREIRTETQATRREITKEIGDTRRELTARFDTLIQDNRGRQPR
jgi:hypothetical protein